MDPGDGKRLLRQHFRCPEEIPSFTVAPGLSQPSGFFRLNAETICFGQCSSVAPAASVAEAPPVATADVKLLPRPFSCHSIRYRSSKICAARGIFPGRSSTKAAWGQIRSFETSIIWGVHSCRP
jgi:hypothetical protein